MVGALLSWLLAVFWRLRSLDQASIGSDSLGQFLPGLAPGTLPPPPNPEAGYALWVTAAPLVAAAGSLEELLTLRFVLGALIAPLGFLAAWSVARQRRLLAGSITGAVLAVDSGLVDTLVSAFRGYGAPELLAGAALCLLAWSGRAGTIAGVVLLIVAAGHHPFAAGAVAGVVLILPWQDRKTMAAAVLIGLLVAIPRLLWIGSMADCGDGILGCLSPIALGSSEPLGRWALLQRAMSDRAGELSTGLIPLLVGLALCRDRRTLLLAVGAAAGVMLLALSVHSLRPYHLRIVAAPLAIAAGVGLARVGWMGGIGGLWAALALALHPPPLGDPGAIARHDAAAAELAAIPAPVWVEGAWYGGPIALEPAGVVLSACLQGQPPERFAPGGHIVLLVSRPDGATVQPLEDAAAAQDWLRSAGPPEVLGGAADWASILQPGAGADWW